MTGVLAPLLIVLSAVSFAILFIGHGSSALSETLSLLISMGLLFFSSHALAHFVIARIYRVKVSYFFIGRSDFRKLTGLVGRIGGLVPTIGTKFDSSQLSALTRGKRAILFGSGAIASTVLIGFMLLIAFFFDFASIALIFGFLFVVSTIFTEISFGTKVGDFGKMRREYSR